VGIFALTCGVDDVTHHALRNATLSYELLEQNIHLGFVLSSKGSHVLDSIL
jgi:hypothetical protein